MPEIEEGQTAAAEPAPFHVELSEGDAPLAPDDDEAAQEQTEPEAGEPSETAAESDEDQPTPPTAESLGLDLKLPKDKAAYTELMKKFGQWTNKFMAKHKQKPESAPVEPQQEVPASAPTEGEGDYYSVPLDAFKYDGGAEPDDSDLKGYEASIDRRIEQGVKKAIEFTLGQMRVNEAKMREQAQVMTAQERIVKYAETLQAHPEWEEKAPLVAKIAKGTRQLAVEDPEEWISMVEARTGISRNWREAEAKETAAQETQRGQQNQRTATRLQSVVTRPTRAPAPRPAADTSWDAALDANMKRMGL